MIRYRPHRVTLNASLKDELLFSSADDMLSYISEHCQKIFNYIGSSKPFHPDDIMIDAAGVCNPMVGYQHEHRILIRRSRDVCIGYCDMEG